MKQSITKYTGLTFNLLSQSPFQAHIDSIRGLFKLISFKVSQVIVIEKFKDAIRG